MSVTRLLEICFCAASLLLLNATTTMAAFSVQVNVYSSSTSASPLSSFTVNDNDANDLDPAIGGISFFQNSSNLAFNFGGQSVSPGVTQSSFVVDSLNISRIATGANRFGEVILIQDAALAGSGPTASGVLSGTVLANGNNPGTPGLNLDVSLQANSEPPLVLLDDTLSGSGPQSTSGTNSQFYSGLTTPINLQMTFTADGFVNASQSVLFSTPAGIVSGFNAPAPATLPIAAACFPMLSVVGMLRRRRAAKV